MILQWIQGGVDKAEKSFKAINGAATPIDATEMKMIDERKKPTALAARAIIHAATGHPYWSNFEENVRSEIEVTAIQTHNLLFEPEYSDAIDKLDLPVAGKAYSGEGVKLVYDLVEFASRRIRAQQGGRIAFGATVKTLKELEDDLTGHDTLAHLKLVKKTLESVTGKSPGSLGLHPAVYYYSATGARQSAAFFAAIRFVEDLRHKELLIRFTERRKVFEDFLVKYKNFINQIIRKRGSGERGLPTLTELYRCIFEGISTDKTEDEIIKEILEEELLSFLVVPQPIAGISGGSFSKSAKKAASIRATLEAAPLCRECGARFQLNSATIDHIIRREDGGTNSSENAALIHPFCNSGYKEHKRSLDLKNTQ